MGCPSKAAGRANSFFKNVAEIRFGVLRAHSRAARIKVAVCAFGDGDVAPPHVNDRFSARRPWPMQIAIALEFFCGLFPS